MENSPVNTANEHVPKKVTFVELDMLAEGKIGETRETRPRLDELTERVGSGEFHVETTLRLPCGCIDGRPGGALRPNAAGGSFSLAVADDLLERRFVGDGSVADMAQATLRHLRDHEHPVGCHTATETHGLDLSGCGANDRLDDIYGLMHKKSDIMQGLATTLGGLQVSEGDHAAIIAGAERRTTFSAGRTVLDRMKHVRAT